MSDRAGWPIKRRKLGEDDRGVITGSTPSELFAMVEQLTRDAWAMAGRSMPETARAELPGRLIRRPT